MLVKFGKNWGRDLQRESEDVKEEMAGGRHLGLSNRPDPNFKKAFQAWLSYYDQLEEYEQKICQARTPDGIALPRAGEELRLSAQKSRLLREELFQPLKALQIPAQIEEAARELALKEHRKKWQTSKSRN